MAHVAEPAMDAINAAGTLFMGYNNAPLWLFMSIVTLANPAFPLPPLTAPLPFPADT